MKKIFTIILLSLFVISTTTFASSTTIQNSISVTTNGGVGTTHVKTTYNGEVIEDTNISTTTSYKHNSKYTFNDDVIEAAENNYETEEQDKIIKLSALLNELRTLLAYYEKLLAEQTLN